MRFCYSYRTYFCNTTNRNFATVQKSLRATLRSTFTPAQKTAIFDVLQNFCYFVTVAL